MSEDNRKRPCIIRVLPTVDARVRAYAARQGLAPNVAAEDLINAAAGEIAALDKQLVALRADLESAREATRRADAEVERLTAEATVRAREYALAAAKLGTETDRLTRELAEAITSRARLADELASATEREQRMAAPCACALPDDFEAKLAERAPAWKGTLPELRARVITLGFSRYDALATDAAKRAAERGR